MSKMMEKNRFSEGVKVACWLVAALTAATALAGYLCFAFGRRTGVAAALITVSSFLTIGLCALLVHRYDKQADRTGVILYGRMMHGLMLHALFVAIAGLVHAANASPRDGVIAVALADGALTVTMVFLLAGVRRNWNGAANTWVWMALLLGVAVVVLGASGVNWLVWLMMAALAGAVVAYSACKPGMRNNLCNLIFAFAGAIFAVALLLGGHAATLQMILHILYLILTPIYALGVFLMGEAMPVRLADGSDSRCLHNGKTVIYSHAAANPLVTPDGNALDDTPANDDLELAAIQEKILAWKAEDESVSHAQDSGKGEMDSASEAVCDADERETVSPEGKALEQNCDGILHEPYRGLSLKYLSIAPLAAFSELSLAQLACLGAFGVHTVAELVALPACRIAQQIVWMASCEEETAGN